jgi:hypothetical protein
MQQLFCLGERRGAYRVLVEKTEKRKPHGRPRLKWEYNIKTPLQEVDGRGGAWTRSIWLRIGIGGGLL